MAKSSEMATGTGVAGSEFSPGKAVGDSSLSGAVADLHSQHPHKWDDLGPHHGGNEHLVHQPKPLRPSGRN